ncbi:MAG TPA: hypothetical protein EYP33_06695, partial [Pyrodictium sp.]|nr:hypothetical protein [Pyrodictium sp.]
MTKSQLEALTSTQWSASGGFLSGSTNYLNLAIGLYSLNQRYSPYVDEISFNFTPKYPTDQPTITNNTGVKYLNLHSFSAVLGEQNTGTVKFQISKDGTVWMYWNGSSWTQATSLSQANTDDEINLHLSEWNSQVGPGTFYFKAIFVNNPQPGEEFVQLEGINLAYDPFDFLISPNGGEGFVVGAQEAIIWNASLLSTSQYLKIEYSPDGGSSWKTITSQTLNDGRYYWNIPNDPSDNVLIKITDISNPNLFDTSNSPFKIVSATLKSWPFADSSRYSFDQNQLIFSSQGIVQLRSLASDPPQTDNHLDFDQADEWQFIQEDASQGTDFSGGKVKLTSTTQGNPVYNSQDIFVANVGSNTVSFLDASSNYSKTDILAGNTPYNLTADQQGNIWVVPGDVTGILRINAPNYSTTSSYSLGGKTPRGVAIDSSNNLWTSNNDGTLSCLDASNNYQECPGSPFNLGFSSYALVFDQQQRLWITQWTSSNLYCYSYSQGTLTQCPGTPVSGFTQAAGVTIDPSGNLWVSDLGGKVSKVVYDGQTAVKTDYTGAWVNPVGITFDLSGKIWFSDYNGGTGEKVFCFDPQTGQVCSTSSPFNPDGSITLGTFPAGIEVDSSNRLWVIIDSNPGYLKCLEAQTGNSCGSYQVGDTLGTGNPPSLMLNDFTGARLALITSAYNTSQPFYITTSDANQFKTGDWDQINSVTATTTEPQGTSLRWFVSFDGRQTWKYFSQGSWQTASGGLAELSTKGMTTATLNSLTSTEWQAQGGFESGKTQSLDFAFDLSSTDSSLTPEVDQISLNYTPGVFEKDSLLFEKTIDVYNGEAYGIALDSQGNVIIHGIVDDASNNDNYYTVKYDPQGNILWLKEYDGGSYDLGAKVAVDSQDNIIVTGGSHNGSNYDYYTIKYDPSGNEIWNKRYDSGGDDYGFLGLMGIGIDSQDNIVITGYAKGNIHTIKYDSLGNVLWSKTYFNGWGTDLVIDSQDNIYITGSIGNDIALIKYDSSGNEIFVKTYDAGGDFERGLGITLDLQKNIIINGFTNFSGTRDLILLKYDPSGTLLRNKIYDLGADEAGGGVVIDSENYIYALSGYYFYSNPPFHLLKYDPLGNLVGDKPYSGGTAGAADIAIDSSDNKYIAGILSGDILFLKYLSGIGRIT